MKKITPFLWFNNNAEEAVNYYLSIFKDSKIKKTTYYPKATEKVTHKKPGTVMTIVFEMNGQEFIAINGGDMFNFSGAISFVINCETQEEIDYYWNRLSAEGKELECGWLTDKYGMYWQVCPAGIEEWLADADKCERVMGEVMKMKKLDLNKLKNA